MLSLYIWLHSRKQKDKHLLALQSTFHIQPELPEAFVVQHDVVFILSSCMCGEMLFILFIPAFIQDQGWLWEHAEEQGLRENLHASLNSHFL